MSTSTTTDGQPELKRTIGPKLLLLFILGDILGTGIYALTGEVAGEIGGAAWLPLLVAFLVAAISAFSYLEMVTKYPQAAGAALYAHKAFGIHFVTFLVAFAVLSSGITSASTAAKFLGENFIAGFNLEWDQTAVTWIALAFMALLAVVNFRGVSESVKLNVVLTLVEFSGLLIVIVVGFWAVSQGNADFSRAMVFETPDDKGVFLALSAATSLAFFSMVGFEDSVNMAEETRDPVKYFPKVMLTGLGITAVIYVLVSVIAVALVPVGQLSASPTPLLDVVAVGAPGLPVDSIYPFLSMFAVANTALINMLMASRLLYGMSRQGVLPRFLGKVHHRRRSPWASIIFTTVIAFGLITVVTNFMGEDSVKALGGTTALLLLCVFTVVNISVIVLRRRPVDREHFRAPRILPYLGVVTCLFLVGPWAQDPIEYQIAAVMLGLGVILWLVNWWWGRSQGRTPTLDRPEELES